MVTQERWKRAQKYESDYWDSPQKAHEIATEAPAWYGWRAGRLVEELRAAKLPQLVDGSARVIEVGSGPVGVAKFFPAVERVAVDPLDRVYRSNPGLAVHRTSEVDYREGRGESLPCESGAFDLAIIENCIDHVQDMDAVMRELRRVLVPSGVLYLTVNCRSARGYWMHRVLSRLRIDPGHPHTFTPARAEELMRQHGFSVRRTWANQEYEKARQADLDSPVMRDRLKARLGVSEFAVALISVSDTRGDSV